MIVLYVYFKADAADTPVVVAALEALLAGVRRSCGVTGRAGHRLDEAPGKGGPVTWLECYEAEDADALARLRTALADGLRAPACAPLASLPRHVEVFRLGEPGRCA